MPVILTKELESFWLDDDVVDPMVLSNARVPYPAESMDAFEVAPLVNNPANDRPEVVVPVQQSQVSFDGLGLQLQILDTLACPLRK